MSCKNVVPNCRSCLKAIEMKKSQKNLQCPMISVSSHFVLSFTLIYSDSQKHESSCLLSDCFSRMSPEPLELKKSYLHLFASLFEELSDEKIIFQIQLQNQLIFAKTLF